MNYFSTTSESLLEGIQRGEEFAWIRFFDKYRPSIVALGEIKGLTPGQCDDLVQSTMISFQKSSIHFRFEPGKAKFRTFFSTIIKRRISDIKKKDREEKSFISSVDDMESSDAFNEADEPDVLLDKALREEYSKIVCGELLEELKGVVGNRNFLIFNLYVLQERPPREISAMLDVSEQQIYKIKANCKGSLTKIAKRLLLEHSEWQDGFKNLFH